MAKNKVPVTAAVRVFREHDVAFIPCPYKYVDSGGTAQFAAQYQVDEHVVIKTLIMEDEQANPVCVLMHGDLQVSTKALARAMGVKQVTPCIPKVADKHSGYQVGGTSAFGLRKPMPIYAHDEIQGLERMFINGGRRGFIVELGFEDLVRVLNPVFAPLAQQA